MPGRVADADVSGACDARAYKRSCIVAPMQAHRTLKRPIPGFGHLFHKTGDPRPPRLFKVAEKAGVKGAHKACKLAEKHVPYEDPLTR